MSALFYSARLSFAQLSVGDAAWFYALNQDPEVIRYTGDGPFLDEFRAKTFLEKYTPYSETGFGRWAVRFRKTDQAIGWCGLKRRADGQVDLGYRFLRRCWGNGYATEAGEVCLRRGFEHYGLAQIIAEAHRDNTASLAVMRKLGMHLVDHGSDKNELPIVRYAAFASPVRF